MMVRKRRNLGGLPAISILLVAILFWWWLRRRSMEKTMETAPSPDNLARIGGIGPKISGLLQAAGITTFAQLAATEVSQLEQILEQAGLRLANPNTWPEQAKLAAAGDWDGLKTLQSQLKGGRRIQ